MKKINSPHSRRFRLRLSAFLPSWERRRRRGDPPGPATRVWITVVSIFVSITADRISHDFAVDNMIALIAACLFMKWMERSFHIFRISFESKHREDSPLVSWSHVRGRYPRSWRPQCRARSGWRCCNGFYYFCLLLSSFWMLSRLPDRWEKKENWNKVIHALTLSLSHVLIGE